MAGLAVAAAATLGLTGTANAVIIFPQYSPNSNPSLIQQQNVCNTAQILANQCNLSTNAPYRWVRVGGQYVQGPEWQLINELPLVSIACSFAQVSKVPLTETQWKWTWIELAHPRPGVDGEAAAAFCSYQNFQKRNSPSFFNIL